MAGNLREEEDTTASSEAESSEDGGSYMRRSHRGGQSLVGQTLGDRYRVLDFIARGGMGTVYVAEQLGLRRKVALKVLDVRPSDDGADRDEFRKRFEKEASLAAGIAHPNVVVVHDFGQTDLGLYYLAMEYLEGRTLQRDVAEHGPLETSRIIHIALQACAALGAAHAGGLIHRDLKPSNLILIERGQDEDFVKLVDFGLVKEMVARGEAPEPLGVVTKPGTLLGSPAFISPEQILASAVTPAADLYSLGAVLFFMATGVPPFRGRSEYEIIRAHVEQPPPTLREAAPDCTVSPELEAVIRRCLAKKIHERYATVTELAEALEACDQTPQSGLSSRRLIPVSSRPPPAEPEPVAQNPLAEPPRALPVASDAAFAETYHSSMSGTLPPTKQGRSALWLALPLLAVVVGVVFAVVSRAPEATEGNDTSTDGEMVEASPNVPATAIAETLVATSGQSGALSVTTDPPGAVVRYRGLVLGETPLDLSLSPENAPWPLDFELEGYASRRVEIDHDAGDIDVSLVRSRRGYAAPIVGAEQRGPTQETTNGRSATTPDRRRQRVSRRTSADTASEQSVDAPSDAVPQPTEAEPLAVSETETSGTEPPSVVDDQAVRPTGRPPTRRPNPRTTDNLDPWER